MTKNPGILVTGGTGYIGSHTVVELIEKGYDVFIIDNLSNSHAEVIDSIEAITGTRPGFGNIDLNNKSAVQEFLRIHKVEAIIHFAAFKAVGESVDKPIEYYRNNLVSLLNLIEICKENKIKLFAITIDHKMRQSSAFEALELGKILSREKITHQISFPSQEYQILHSQEEFLQNPCIGYYWDNWSCSFNDEK